MSLADGLAWERDNAVPTRHEVLVERHESHGAGFFIPRSHMPQVDEMYYPRFITDAYKGPGVVFDTVHPSTLKAHQRVNHARAKAMSEQGRIKPLIVSRDGYIVDGNHRWWASVHGGHEWVNVIRLNMDFEPALVWLRRKPYVYELTPSTTERT